MIGPLDFLTLYTFGAIYTVAMTIQWQTKIHHIRAAILWPVFWLVVAFSSRRKP